MDQNLLFLFIPTFFAVSITPGMCMVLAMTLGMTIGIKRSIWMMAGELIGVGLVALSALIGVSAILLTRPNLYQSVKLTGQIHPVSCAHFYYSLTVANKAIPSVTNFIDYILIPFKSSVG